MVSGQANKYFIMLEPSSATAGGTITSRTLDCKGAAAVSIVVQGSTSDAATDNPSVLELQECDTDTASSFAAVTAAKGDGAGGFVIPDSPTATTNAAYVVFNVDTKPRKRYLRLVISPTTTQTYYAVAHFPAERMSEMPNTAAKQNASVVVNA